MLACDGRSCSSACKIRRQIAAMPLPLLGLAKEKDAYCIAAELPSLPVLDLNPTLNNAGLTE